MWGGGGGSGGGPYGGHMSQNLHWNTQFLRFYKNHYIIGLSIANELDRERLRNFRGETETEIVRNSNFLLSISRFEHESQKKVASLPILGLDSRSRFSDLAFHSQPWL